MNVIAQPVIFLFFSFVTYACEGNLDVDHKEVPQNSKSEETIENSQNNALHEHKLWDKLTKLYVTEDGFVDYKGFVKDSTKLNQYLELLSANHPNDRWSSDQRKAYWINAYNAFTVKLIVKNYPVKSIKDLGGSIYKVNTPWDIKFINIGDEQYDLNNIEHSILRKEWEDPRIHAAVNCASVSCPGLRQGAFTADNLDKQLDEQMKSFIQDESKNRITKDKLKLSKIFKWFTGDFKNVAPSEIAYLNRFTKVKISEDAEIDYFEYDWDLNESK
jgi:hypothetical protein